MTNTKKKWKRKNGNLKKEIKKKKKKVYKKNPEKFLRGEEKK